MEPNTFPPQWLIYVLTVAGSGVTLIVGSGLTVAVMNRIWSRRDRRHDLHDSNQTAQIGADVTLTQSLLKRIEKLEAGYQDVQEKLAQSMATNARLEEQNVHLKASNEKLETENKERRESMHRLRNEMAGRDLKIQKLEMELDKLKTEIHRDDIHRTDA